MPRNRQPTLVEQLEKLYKMGKFSYSVYKDLTKSSPAKQKKAISRAHGTTSRRQEIKEVKQSVRDLQHRMNNDLATHTHRRIDADRIDCSNNLQSVSNYQLGHAVTYIEGAIAGLRYYNPSNPGVLVTADADTGTFSRKLTIKNIHAEYHFKNNYQVPANLVIYECAVKDDTSIAPSTAMGNGLIDQTATDPGNTSPFMYPTDSNQFNELWAIKKTTRLRLEPGRVFKYKYNSGSFNYDPSLVDSHAMQYQKHFKSRILLIKMIGDVAHDSVMGEEGFCQASVDYVRCITTEIEYEAGTSLKDYSVDNNLEGFTNGPVVCNKPVADNQAYSHA